MANETFSQKMSEAYVVPDVDLNLCSEHALRTTRNVVSWPTQFVTCLGRTLKDQWRNRTMLYLNIFQASIVALFTGLAFLNMGQTNASQARLRADDCDLNDFNSFDLLDSVQTPPRVVSNDDSIIRHPHLQVKRRQLMFLLALNQGVCGSFLAINTFPPDRALMLRERANGMYRSSAYFLAKQFGDFGQVICPWVFSCICYWMARNVVSRSPLLLVILF